MPHLPVRMLTTGSGLNPGPSPGLILKLGREIKIDARGPRESLNIFEWEHENGVSGSLV